MQKNRGCRLVDPDVTVGYPACCSPHIVCPKEVKMYRQNGYGKRENEDGSYKNQLLKKIMSVLVD